MDRSPSRYLLRGLMVAALAVGLGACAKARETLGLDKAPPDEFNVVTRAPLEMPPSLDVLPPPEPGKQRPQELRPQEQAMAILLGAQPVSAGPSDVEEVLMVQASVVEAMPGIRATVDSEQKEMASERTLNEILQFWRDPGDKTAIVIDPAKENQRLQNNAALGLPADAGDFDAVIVTPEERALLQGIF